MTSRKSRSWEGGSAPAPTRSIQAIAEFLSSVVHVHVDPSIFHALGSAESAWMLLAVLLDLCLLAKANWPVDPRERLPGLWEELGPESGAELVLQTGV
jgi:hypothetical protein